MTNKELLNDFVQRVSARYGGHAHTVTNSDASIDAQVTIQLAPSKKPRDAFYEIEAFIREERMWKHMPAKTYVNTGVIYERTYEEAEAVERKQRKQGKIRTTPYGESISRGLAQANTGYVGGSAAIPTSTRTTVDFLVRPIQKAGYSKPHEIFFRLHWNPRGKHPDRTRRNKRIE